MPFLITAFKNSTGVTAEFWVDGARDHMEFPNRVRARNNPRRIQGNVRRVGTVYVKRVLLGLASVGGKVRAHGARPEAVGGPYHARLKLLELNPIPPVQG